MTKAVRVPPPPLERTPLGTLFLDLLLRFQCFQKELVETHLLFAIFVLAIFRILFIRTLDEGSREQQRPLLRREPTRSAEGGMF